MGDAGFPASSIFEKENKMKAILKTTIAVTVLSSCMFLYGCGNEAEDEPIIMVDASEDEIVYKLEEITTGEVLLTKNVSCKYVQTSSQEIAFPSGGKIVDKVYVRVGDSVNIGDPLVALESGNMVDEIANLEYQIARNELQLSYLDKSEEFDKRNSYYSFVYGAGEISEEAKENFDEGIADLEENYIYQREDLSDSIEFDKKKLDKLKKEYDGNCVHATMAGKVLFIKNGLEGSTSKKDDVIMTIVDNDNGLFEIEDPEAALFFKEGEPVDMNVNYGDAKGDYLLLPHDMNNWGEKQQFEIMARPETSTLEVGISGTIVATVDKKENVTRIPVKALYQADDKYYTYVLNEENMREARFIEVGLVGDDYAEVLSGIEVGTKVVRR